MRYALVLLLYCYGSVCVAAEQETGQVLFQSRCMLCHQLPEPAMLRPKQWQAVLGTMQQRMQQAGIPVLTPGEQAAILDYLTKQTDK